ncbi:MAG TPA: hypothetical protein VKU19_09205 [Bryobacteraceae bacterium]|nr:hypothetical protein [Bryobacteraceae bacterium]
MKRAHISKIGGLAFATAVVGITLGNPAMACTRPGGGATASGRPITSRVASLRSLGLLAPPKIGPRQDNATKDTAHDVVSPTIVGLWQVMDTENGQPVDLSFELWHADGTEVLIDQTPPPEGNVCIGTWQQTGPLIYKLTHPALNFDMDGNFIGTVLINEVVTLDRTGLKFSGTYTVDVFDLTGQLVDHEEGQFIGSKVNPPA